MFVIALNIPKEKHQFFGSGLRTLLGHLKVSEHYFLMFLDSPQTAVNLFFPSNQLYHKLDENKPTLIVTIPSSYALSPQNLITPLQIKLSNIVELNVMGVGVDQIQEEGQEESLYLKTYIAR